MATTNVVNSTLFTFRSSAGGAGGTAYGRQTDVTFTESMEARDISSKDSGGYRELLEGRRSAEISFSGFLAFNDSLTVYTSSTGISAVLRARTQQTWILGTGVSGDPKTSGDGYFTTLDIGSPDSEGNCTYSSTLQVTGQWYVGTF